MGFEIILTISALCLLFLILIIFGYKKIRDEKKQGYPARDEMTKKMMIKAGCYAYWISIPMWLIISFLTLILHNDFMNEFNVIIGILGMSIIYLFTAVYMIMRGAE